MSTCVKIERVLLNVSFCLEDRLRNNSNHRPVKRDGSYYFRDKDFNECILNSYLFAEVQLAIFFTLDRDARVGRRNVATFFLHGSVVLWITSAPVTVGEEKNKKQREDVISFFEESLRAVSVPISPLSAAGLKVSVLADY